MNRIPIFPGGFLLSIFLLPLLFLDCNRHGTIGDSFDEINNQRILQIMQRVLKPDSSCVDVGSYKGEILASMEQLAPRGIHYAFEPLPHLFSGLQKRFTGANIRLYRLALGDRMGTTTFHHVVSNPAYSGIRKRHYDRENERVKKITVRIDTLDHILPVDAQIRFIKIDVEGAELLVLQGARRTILRNRPLIVFEHGQGASEYYGTTPEKVYALLGGDYGLKINSLDRWLQGRPPFTRDQFLKQYYERHDCNYIAYP